MTIWLAALYSLGAIGLSVIASALGAGLIMWAIESRHEVVVWTAMLTACGIMFAICFYIEGGAA